MRTVLSSLQTNSAPEDCGNYGPNTMHGESIRRRRLENRVFLGEEDRAVRQIAEASFVLGEQLVGGLPFGRGKRGGEIGGTVPPDFRNPIVGRLRAAGNLSVDVERCVKRMALHIAPGLECLRLPVDQRAVAFDPVFAKFLYGKGGMAAHAINELDNKIVASDGV